MKKHRKASIITMIFGFFAVCTLIAALPMPKNFRAHLSGADAGADTLGQGQAIFQLSKDGGHIKFKLNVANIENVTMAHIHIAPPGQVNGPPAVWLYPSGPPPQLISGRYDGVLAAGAFMESNLVGPLLNGTFADLIQAIQEGRAYVNVHTLQYPGGEIRGTIF